MPKKGDDTLISTNDLYKEIGIIEDAIKGEEITDLEFKKMQLKIGTLSLKLAHNQRTNLVQIMKKLGATTIEPKEKKEQ